MFVPMDYVDLRSLLISNKANLLVSAVAKGFVGRTPTTAERFIRTLIYRFALAVEHRKITGDMQRAIGSGFDM